MSIGEYEDTFKSCYEESPTFEDNKAYRWMNRCTLECKECQEPRPFNARNKLMLHLVSM
jgi:hypothetical protein